MCVRVQVRTCDGFGRQSEWQRWWDNDIDALLFFKLCERKYTRSTLGTHELLCAVRTQMATPTFFYSFHYYIHWVGPSSIFTRFILHETCTFFLSSSSSNFQINDSINTYRTYWTRYDENSKRKKIHKNVKLNYSINKYEMLAANGRKMRVQHLSRENLIQNNGNDFFPENEMSCFRCIGHSACSADWCQQGNRTLNPQSSDTHSHRPNRRRFYAIKSTERERGRQREKE